MSQGADRTTQRAQPHLTEGELHALLDGALDQLGKARAVEAREHLRECTLCRDALSAEERVRAQADEVLALSAPRVAEIPPFETLVARAGSNSGAPPRAARLSRAARLGWAASIVIALGAGWLAHELGLHTPALQEPTRGTPLVRDLPTEAPRAAMAPSMSDVEAAQVPESGEPAAAAQEAPAPVAVEPDAAREITVLLNLPVHERTIATTVSLPPVSELSLEPLLAAGAIGEQSEGRNEAGPEGTPPRAELERRGVTLLQRALTSVPPAPAEVGIQESVGGSVGVGVPPLFTGRADMDRDAEAVNRIAEPDEALDLAVPGLEVLRVEWLAIAPRQPSLRVLQRLPSGDTLEARFVRAPVGDVGGDPLALLTSVPLEAGWSQVVKAHGDGWLVARAPLAQEELEVLVERAGAR